MIELCKLFLITVLIIERLNISYTNLMIQCLPVKGLKRPARFVNQTLCCLFFIASELSTPFWEQWCPCNISIKRVRDLTLIYISEYHDHVLLCILIRTLTELESNQI